MKEIDENNIYTAIVTLQVKPGSELLYENWQDKITQAALKFEGHLGVNSLRPPSGRAPEYVTVFRFHGYENLKRWINSPIRQELLEEVKPLLEKTAEVQILEGMANWFTLPGRPELKPPPKYKMAILLWVAVFLQLTFLSPLIVKLLEGLPKIIITAVNTGIIVILTTYFIMPYITKVFNKWLRQP